MIAARHWRTRKEVSYNGKRDMFDIYGRDPRVDRAVIMSILDRKVQHLVESKSYK